MNPIDADLPTTAQRRRFTHHSPTTVQPHHSPPMPTNPATHQCRSTHSTTTTTNETKRRSTWVWGNRRCGSKAIGGLGWLGRVGDGEWRSLKRVTVSFKSGLGWLGRASDGEWGSLREWLREDESLREFWERIRALDEVTEREREAQSERENEIIF